MPIITFRGQEIECDTGEILRDVLLEAGVSPHNGRADMLNCGGHGTCGTCAVDITGDVSDPGRREKVRLSVPPHDSDDGLRLACQTRIQGDVTVHKYPGFWGQHTNQDPEE
jgi:ferredoxin